MQPDDVARARRALCFLAYLGRMMVTAIWHRPSYQVPVTTHHWITASTSGVQRYYPFSTHPHPPREFPRSGHCRSRAVVSTAL